MIRLILFPEFLLLFKLRRIWDPHLNQFPILSVLFFKILLTPTFPLSYPNLHQVLRSPWQRLIERSELVPSLWLQTEKRNAPSEPIFALPSPRHQSQNFKKYYARLHMTLYSFKSRASQCIAHCFYVYQTGCLRHHQYSRGSWYYPRFQFYC